MDEGRVGGVVGVGDGLSVPHRSRTTGPRAELRQRVPAADAAERRLRAPSASSGRGHRTRLADADRSSVPPLEESGCGVSFDLSFVCFVIHTFHHSFLYLTGSTGDSRGVTVMFFCVLL